MMFRKIEMLYNGGLIARRTWRLEGELGEWGVPLKCIHLACSFHSFFSVIRISPFDLYSLEVVVSINIIYTELFLIRISKFYLRRECSM